MEATVKLVNGPSSWKSNGSTPTTSANATSRVLVTPKTQTNFPRDSPVCDVLFFLLQRVLSGPPPSSLFFPFSFHFSPYIPRITPRPPSLNSLARRFGYSRYFHYSRKFIARHVPTTFQGYPKQMGSMSRHCDPLQATEMHRFTPLSTRLLFSSLHLGGELGLSASPLSLSPLPPLLLFAPLLDVLTLTRGTQCTRPYCSLSAYRCNYRPAGLYTG